MQIEVTEDPLRLQRVYIVRVDDRDFMEGPADSGFGLPEHRPMTALLLRLARLAHALESRGLVDAFHDRRPQHPEDLFRERILMEVEWAAQLMAERQARSSADSLPPEPPEAQRGPRLG